MVPDAPRRAPGARAAAVLFFVVLPIAVAIGVLVGKGNGNNDQSSPTRSRACRRAGGSGGQLASTAATTPITSDFTLDKGYTVELEDPPRRRHRPSGGRLGQAGRHLPGGGRRRDHQHAPSSRSRRRRRRIRYVLYSGQFKSKAEATKALGKLKGKFKDAQVVSVKKNASGEGQLVNKTAYGDVHKVEGFTPSAQKVASDTAIVNQEAQKTGKNYIDSQKDLPDVIVVGGSGGGSSNPAGQGNGD